VVNVKPSRIGSVRALFEVYARCARERRPMYGGGIGELGVGREQIELLAALFHADAPTRWRPMRGNRTSRTIAFILWLPRISPAVRRHSHREGRMRTQWQGGRWRFAMPDSAERAGGIVQEPAFAVPPAGLEPAISCVEGMKPSIADDRSDRQCVREITIVGHRSWTPF